METQIIGEKTLLFKDISLRDWQICFEVYKLGTLRSVARQFDVEPSQISKAISRVEKSIGEPLFNRSQNGMSLTGFGNSILNEIEKILDSGNNLQAKIAGLDQRKELTTIGALSFLNQELLAPSLPDLFNSKPNIRYRLVDMSPDQMVAAGLAGAFDIAVYSGRQNWSEAWSTKKLGIIKWKLVAAANHPLKSLSDEASVLKYPFVLPCYWSQRGYSFGNDYCPVPPSGRIKGTETSTAYSAVNVVENTDQISFLPDIVCNKKIADGSLKSLVVKGWNYHEMPLFIAVRSEKIKASWLKTISSILSKNLDKALS